MINEGLDQTVQWFHDAVDVQARRIFRLERSLFFYRAGFYGLAIVLAVFVFVAVLEALS